MATIFVQGNMLRVSVGATIPSEPPKVAERGDVTSFSARSRARLLRKLNTLVFDRAVFATYTYHRLVSDWEETARDWNRFVTDIRRAGMKGVWVREIQRRGAYHYHVLYLDVEEEQVVRCNKYWYSVEEDSDDAHKKYGIKVSEVDAPPRAVAYIAKYATKSQDSFRGRRWAVFGRPKFAAERVITVPDDVALRVLDELDGRVMAYRYGHVVRAVHFAGNLGAETPEVGELSLVACAKSLRDISVA